MSAPPKLGFYNMLMLQSELVLNQSQLPWATCTLLRIYSASYVMFAIHAVIYVLVPLPK